MKISQFYCDNEYYVYVNFFYFLYFYGKICLRFFLLASHHKMHIIYLFAILVDGFCDS